MFFTDTVPIRGFRGSPIENNKQIKKTIGLMVCLLIWYKLRGQNLSCAEVSQKKLRLRGLRVSPSCSSFRPPMLVADWSCAACPGIWTFSFTDLPKFALCRERQSLTILTEIYLESMLRSTCGANCRERPTGVLISGVSAGVALSYDKVLVSKFHRYKPHKRLDAPTANSTKD